MDLNTIKSPPWLERLLDQYWEFHSMFELQFILSCIVQCNFAPCTNNNIWQNAHKGLAVCPSVVMGFFGPFPMLGGCYFWEPAG